MTTKTLYTCDRCGEEIDYQERMILDVSTSGFPPDREHQLLDLCPRCYDRFIDFIKCRPIKGLLKVTKG